VRTHGWEVTADVEKEYYKALRRFIVAAARPCGSDRLLTYKDDLRARIRESPLFDSYVVVQVTGEVERMLVARCTAAQFGVKPARLAKELQRLWAHQLRFRYMEAHVLRFEADAVALNFVTQMGPSDGFITGAMVAKVRHRTAVDSVEDDDPEDQYVI
jgi:hypothetical protein